jgi:hypothetical protein
MLAWAKPKNDWILFLSIPPSPPPKKKIFRGHFGVLWDIEIASSFLVEFMYQAIVIIGSNIDDV